MNGFLHVNRSFIVLMSFLLSSVFTTAQSGFWTEDGNYDKDWPNGHIENNIYQIRDAGDLAAFARLITDYQSCSVQITSNIDLSAHYWVPIGHMSNSSISFSGVFDGCEHTVSNLYIDITSLEAIGRDDYLSIGLFRNNKGTIRNVNLENIRIKGTNTCSRYFIGGLVGTINDSKGLIENCKVSGSQDMLEITLPDSHGDISIGGIVGSEATYSYIKNCVSDIPISFTPLNGGGVSLGGIAGNADGFVLGCSNKKVIAGDCSAIGGIAGTSEPGSDLFGYLEDCSNYGDITNIRGASAGGIVGSGSYITRCSNAGNVTSGFKAAGIVGNMPVKYTEDITYCYNSGSISVNLGVSENSDYECFCGGIVGGGGVYGISNCYNTGHLSMKPSSEASNATKVYIGGIAACVGSYLVAAEKVINCYNTADISVITSGQCYAGGIIGGGASKETSSCYNTGKIEVESTKLESITAVGISNSGSVTSCLSLAKDRSVPFIHAIGGERSEIYRLTSSNRDCDNNYANAPMILQLGSKIYTATDNVSKNDVNGANWQDVGNTSLPISDWVDEAWDKSDNTILPQLKYADGSLVPDQPRLLKSDFETETVEEPVASIGDTILVDNLQFKILSETTVSVVGPDVDDGSTWSVTDCTIPATVSDGGKTYNVTAIEESAFYECTKLARVTLPNGLKNISKNAFKHCYALTSIEIPASVETIGQYAFNMDENLTQVTLHEGVKEIGEGAFDECGVKEIVIPASVTLLGSMEDGLNNPDIGVLERINIHPDNVVYTSVDGILYNKAKTELLLCPIEYPVKNVTLPAGLVRIVDNAMAYCDFIESIVLPEGLEVIEYAAFECCDALKSITIPSTLKEMGGYLFGTPYSEDKFCALQEIRSSHKAPGEIRMDDADPLAKINKNTCKLYVPKGTKPLYAAASGWKDFKNIIEEGGTTVVSFTIGQLQYKVTAANEVMIIGVTDKNPEYYDIKPSVTYEGTTYNVTAVGERAFDDCRNLVRFQPERVKMPLKEIGKEAFRGCEKLTALLLGSPLETIGDGVFLRCSSLQNLEIPAGVTSIGKGVFDECTKLAGIAVNSANKHYMSSNGVLYNKERTVLFVCPNMHGDSYIIPSGVKRIGEGAFYCCGNIRTIVLPEGLESIGDGAFDGCTGLESLTLPASLKSIGMGIVDHCEETLKEIHSKMVQPLPLGEYAFFYYSRQSDICVLYVPKGSKDSYSKAAGWKNFKHIVEEGESVDPEDTLNPEVQEVSDSTLTVTWEPVAEATDYILKIYRDAAKTELIATYTFDANGQMKSTGFSYLLKGLEAGSTYYIETTAVKQVGGETIVLAQSTTVAETTGTSVGNMEVTADKPQIRVSDGLVWIQSPLEIEVKIYNLSGYCVCAKRISGTSSIRLASGMYIVMIGDNRYKILIR